MGKAAKFHLFWIVRVGVLDQPDFAAARADRDLAVGQHFEGAGLEHLARGRRERQEFVVVGLGGFSRCLLQGLVLLSLAVYRQQRAGHDRSEEERVSDETLHGGVLLNVIKGYPVGCGSVGRNSNPSVKAGRIGNPSYRICPSGAPQLVTMRIPTRYGPCRRRSGPARATRPCRPTGAPLAPRHCRLSVSRLRRLDNTLCQSPRSCSQPRRGRRGCPLVSTRWRSGHGGATPPCPSPPGWESPRTRSPPG